MLTHHRRPVSLSLMSVDLPILSSVETSATLYKKDSNWFHVLLNEGSIPRSVTEFHSPVIDREEHQLLWLEISPYRVIMTMQGKGKFAYRHYWEQGIYGVSRYWLNGDDPKETDAFRLRNFTRSLQLKGLNLPEYLRVEYELWSNQVRLGHYVLHLEIFN
ncbi:conserved hypothetical protein [Gloeothece citriformis PCC 7424]|uniref:Uncharacterized protein n=1 Tax=Gloeothece citriformis (strain PCC 7424) TaxID=65393 RepID=B7KFW2_GLOC7|nr:hypothetical protein [Gloeothece citriformis]ACK69155.1 conserved hypothetical protein [Gloeothece citriformis PCC 7424]